jgi:YD repeat-containing protein
VTKKVIENANRMIPNETVLYSYDEACVLNGAKYTGITTTTVSNYADDAPDIVTTRYIDGFGNTAYTGAIINGSEVRDTYSYDYRGNVTSTKTAEGILTQYEHDYAGRVVKTTNANGNSATNSFDFLGNLINSTDYEGNRINNAYDALGRLIKTWGYIESGFTFGTKYYYSPAGELIRESKKSNAKSQGDSWSNTEYSYNARGLLEYVTQYDGGAVDNITKYSYDGVGNPRTVTYGLSSATSRDGKTVTYSYDQFGNVLTRTDESGKSATYTYSDNGRLNTYTDRNGNVATYTIDSLGRMFSVSTAAPDGSAITTKTRFAPNGEPVIKIETGDSGTTRLESGKR